MGFCFVNNVVVAAAHAYQTYQIDRIVILDIDLVSFRSKARL